jgi:uncharacterized protein (DUF1501 family)
VSHCSRRWFLRGSGATLLGLGFRPFPFLVRAAGSAADRRVLVALFQRGGVDGLNMIPPHGDPDYHRVRPGLAVARPGAPEGALDLDGFYGLHPALAPLRPLYSGGELAIVHAAGSHHNTRSHFDAQDFMETGAPGLKSIREGWLNRAARDIEGENVLEAVAVSNRLPVALQGDTSAAAVKQIADFTLRAGAASNEAEKRLDFMYGASPDIVGRTGRDMLETIRVLRSAAGGSLGPQHAAVYPDTPAGATLRETAALIRADVGLRIAFVDVPDWDHHANELTLLGPQLWDLAASLEAFHRDLGPLMADVVVLSMTEFGRTVAQNGSRGTDHGHASALLVLGGPVRGGRVYGRWPGLSPADLYEGRDLAVTTDFREVFAEVARMHLGLTAMGALFPGFVPAAPLRILG